MLKNLKENRALKLQNKALILFCGTLTTNVSTTSKRWKFQKDEAHSLAKDMK